MINLPLTIGKMPSTISKQVVLVSEAISPSLQLGDKGGNTPRVQGFIREVTGKETGGNELAPPVANSCGGRGKFLRRTCEYLAAAAKRLKPLDFWRWLTRRSDSLF